MVRIYSLVILLLVLAISGCSIGYRYHHLDDSIENAAGANAQIDGAGHTLYMSTVLDFRYVRLVSSYLFPSYSYDIEDDRGGSEQHDSRFETRGAQIDAPLISLWSDDEETTIGYPGRMEHRQSLELWISGSTRGDMQPSFWGDVGLVYYHHELLAARAFAGWGAIAVDDATSRIDSQGNQDELWQAPVFGPSAGVDVTLAAGEYALDFIKFFLEAQEDAGQAPN